MRLKLDLILLPLKRGKYIKRPLSAGTKTPRQGCVAQSYALQQRALKIVNVNCNIAHVGAAMPRRLSPGSVTRFCEGFLLRVGRRM